MKKLTISIDDVEATVILRDAKAQKRSFKSQVEFIIMESMRKNNTNTAPIVAKKESWAID